MDNEDGLCLYILSDRMSMKDCFCNPMRCASSGVSALSIFFPERLDICECSARCVLLSGVVLNDPLLLLLHFVCFV